MNSLLSILDYTNVCERERLDDAVYCFNVMRGGDAEAQNALP